MKEEIRELLKNDLLEIMPFNIAVIDRNFNVVLANKNFKDYFGEWRGRRCFEVCKDLNKACPNCKAREVFETGNIRVSDESGINKKGRDCHYVVHLAPLKNGDGEIEYVVEMSYDITRRNLFQRNYNLLFERVPNYISIIDRDFRIVRANEKFREKFGDARGKYCYEAYKKKGRKCDNCPAALTFRDGKEHSSTQVGISVDGEKTYYAVKTAPLSKKGEDVSLVIEIATDITEQKSMEEEVIRTHDFYEKLIENATDGILAINNEGRTKIFNPSARKILDWNIEDAPKIAKIKEMLPESFFNKADNNSKIAEMEDTYVRNFHDEEIPVRFNAFELTSNDHVLGRAAFIEDLRKLKQLEKQRLDAERLGAVGETVAGLAHTIKNLLMGLEGGMYMVDSGLKRGDAKRIYEGWDVLQRNFDKTTGLVKGFLNFAKGRVPEQKLIDPNKLVADIVELYEGSAEKQGVELIFDPAPNLEKAWLDPEGIEACLTNLLSNGIDAAVMGEGKGRVIIRTRDDGDNLVFEVEDNGIGMDSEVIQKVFTTFFTTKGNKGTGLGLLTTNKIVKEHGGKIEADSDVGKGSVFRMKFRRTILYMIAAESGKH